MAAICPNCHKPEVVTYIVNDDGIHPSPCLECRASTITSGPYVSLTGATSCGTGGCAGSVRDEYSYDQQGRLRSLVRTQCPRCGTLKTNASSDATGPREHFMPDPRMRRVPSHHLGD